jgi:hypothetical protein
VKIHCTLGLIFFHLPNWPVRNGLCSAFGIWKMKKWRHFVNAFLSVRQSLRNLKRCGAFIAVFTSEKQKTTIKKKFIPRLDWLLILNFFIAHFPILVLCKTKGAVGCAIYCAFGN